ncbi:tRNA threonylcarbamoyladenosine biosynthesis protein TsaB [Halarsenatibacter silvermanii]|uniref:tRNA threonylcarbamoyladenosine biosynthesis protein TsaB n=1 Tax=Halarsenatibacter silvermanii TaxID=321763 RepID=A0A1G9NET2_9FIRM|nr:tRNA threonylcarbamoyladenosine biosynthesis protein TsaB [Halarsenatibacter silvermanii]
MNVAGIDTASDILGLGFCRDNKIMGEINIRLDQSHNQRLLPLFDVLMGEVGCRLSDLDGIAVVTGPGSFTGLRISLSTVKAFSISQDLSLLEVSSLELLIADRLNQPGFWLPAYDARGDRIYTAIFSGGKELTDKKARVLEDQAVALAELPELLKEELPEKFRLTITGPAVNRYIEQFREVKANLPGEIVLDKRYTARPAGGRLARLGVDFLEKNMRIVGPDELQPRYLKKPQAEIDHEKN